MISVYNEMIKFYPLYHCIKFLSAPKAFFPPDDNLSLLLKQTKE